MRVPLSYSETSRQVVVTVKYLFERWRVNSDFDHEIHVSRKSVSPSFCFRLSTLLREIMAEKENKSIVFIETKRRVDEITRKMKRDG